MLSFHHSTMDDVDMHEAIDDFEQIGNLEEEQEAEAEPEDTAVANTMKTFEGADADGDEDDEGEDEAWGQPTAGAATATYAD